MDQSDSEVSPGSHLFDAEGHQDRVAELGEEDEEKHHEPHAGVGFEGFVGRAEPAEEGQRDEEDDVSQGQTEGASVVQATEEIAESSEEIGEIQDGVHCSSKMITMTASPPLLTHITKDSKAS